MVCAKFSCMATGLLDLMAGKVKSFLVEMESHRKDNEPRTR
jgi:hypothetical protein